MKSKIIILHLLVLALLAVGCSDDFLERVPEGNYTGESYYSSDKAVLKAGEPLYNRAWFNFNRRATIGLGSFRANDGWSPYLNGEFNRFQTTALTPEVLQAWASLYTVVTMSNSILNDITKYSTESVTEEAKSQVMGEAYLMRGTAYFYLLRIWGPVILFESNDDMVLTPKQPLNPEEDVLKFIVRDLRKAVELLPLTMKDGRASAYSAKAMLAKVLLAQSGWNKSTRDESILAECIELCEDVIDNSHAKLLPNYEDLYKYSFNDNEETLLALKWASPLTGSWGDCNALLSDISFSDVCDVNCWGGSLTASVDMLDIYNSDLQDSIRLKATFFSKGRHYDYVKSASGGFTFEKNWMLLKKYVVGSKEDCNGQLAQMASPLNTYLLRLGDTYLTLAEAYLGNKSELTGGRGLESFNAIRARAEVDSYDKITFEDIIRERRIEFCMEYCNWYDMVSWYRWKPDYMLDFFNNKQHRAYEIQDGGIQVNDDGSFRYYLINWFPYEDGEQLTAEDGSILRVWSDGIRYDNTEQTMWRSVEDGYEYNVLNYLNSGVAPNRIVLSEANIFVPYPETDRLQNPFLSQEPQPYDFGSGE